MHYGLHTLDQVHFRYQGSSSSLSSLDDLYALDLLTIAEEVQLYRTRMSLFNTVANMGGSANPDHSSGVAGATDGYQAVPPHTHTNDGRVMTRSRGSPDDAISDRRAEKRRMLAGVSEPGAVNPVNLMDMDRMTLDKPPYKGATDAVLHAPQATGGPTANFPTGTPGIDHPRHNPMNVGYGPQSPWPRSGSTPAPGTPNYYNQMYFQTPVRTPGLILGNKTFAIPPGLRSSISMSPSPLFSRGRIASRTVNPQHLQRGSGSAGALSGVTSAGAASFNDTIFSASPSHSHLFIGSADAPADMLPHEGPSAANLFHGAASPADPFTGPRQPDSTVKDHDATLHNWEKDQLIQFWVGKTAPPERLEAAMSAGQTPCSEDQLHPEWKTLSTTDFRGNRSALSLAVHWSTILEQYKDIRAYGTSLDGGDNTAAGIAARAMERVGNQPTTMNITGKCTVGDIRMWCVDGLSSWFADMHARLQYYQGPQTESANISTHLRSPPTMLGYRAPSIQSSSSASRPAPVPIPSHPASASQGQSAGGSALGMHAGVGVPGLGQPGHSAVPVEGRAFYLPRNYASMEEMTRDNHVLTEESRGVVGSKGDYLRAKTLNAHIESMERLLNMHLAYIDFQSRAIQSILLDNSISPESRAAAKQTLTQLHLSNPFSVDYDLLLDHLELAMKRKGLLPA